MRMKKRAVFAVVCAAVLMTAHVQAAVVAAWDFMDRRGAPEAGWTEWTTSDMTNGVANTAGGITIDVEYSGGSDNFYEGVKQIDGRANFIAEDPALLMLTTNAAGQNVYEDYLGQLNVSQPVFTLSGLTPGYEYKVQFVGTFNLDGKNISVSQDGAAAINIIEGANSVANDIAYSRYFMFTAAAGNTDVSFELNNIGGVNQQQGVCGVIVDAVFPEESPVMTGFLGAGIDPASTTVTWTNLADTVTVSAIGTADPTIDAPNTVFSKQNSTGSIGMDVVALSEIGGAFNPTNWTGGTTAGATVHTTTAGWGVNDSNGNGNIQAGEALILTFDFSSLGLASNHTVKLAGFNLGVDTAEVWQKTGAASGELVGSGIAPVLAIELSDGDELALVNSASTAMRLKSLSLDVDEIPTTTKTPAGLTALAGDSVAILDWDDDTTGFLDFYTVHRGTTSGTNNYTFSTNVTDSAYLDTGLANGTTYYYAVTATDTNGLETGFSDEVAATPFDASTDVVMIQNLDAANAASVTTNASGEVTLWADLSGNGNDAEPDVGIVRWPSASISQSGLSGMDMNTNKATLNLFSAAESDAFLDFTGGAISNNGFCAMVAFKNDSIITNAGFGNQIILGNGLDSFSMVLQADGNLQVTAGRLNNMPANVQEGDTVILAMNYKANTGQLEFWNSRMDVVSNITTEVYGDFSTGAPVRLGGVDNTSRYIDGMVGEVKIFSSYLDAATFKSERDALVAQWGTATVNLYAEWAAVYGLTGEDAAETNDVEPDGLNNLMEYAFGGNPTNADAAAVNPTVATLVEGGTNWFYHVHNERTDDDSLSYTLDLADNLAYPVWTNAGLEFVDESPEVDSFKTVTNRTDVNSVEFIRLEVEK